MNKLKLPRLLTLTLVIPAAHAAETGHFSPGVLNIRDFALPAQGFYAVIYNYGYSTDQLNDADGNKIESIPIGPGPGPGVTLWTGVVSGEHDDERNDSEERT